MDPRDNSQLTVAFNDSTALLVKNRDSFKVFLKNYKENNNFVSYNFNFIYVTLVKIIHFNFPIFFINSNFGKTYCKGIKARDFKFKIATFVSLILILSLNYI